MEITFILTLSLGQPLLFLTFYIQKTVNISTVVLPVDSFCIDNYLLRQCVCPFWYCFKLLYHMAHLVFLEALALSFAVFFYLLFNQVIRFLILLSPLIFIQHTQQLLLYNDHSNVLTRNSNILTHSYPQVPISSFHMQKVQFTTEICQPIIFCWNLQLLQMSHYYVYFAYFLKYCNTAVI